MRFLTFFFLTVALLCSAKVGAQERYRLVFWNIENLFDTFDDSIHNDADFTPEGQYHWTNRRYQTKQRHLAQTFIAMGVYNSGTLEMPLAIGMAEVENDKVLRDLCRGTLLRNFRYDFVHFDSPDRRGIDNALLYRSDKFQPFLSQRISVSDSTTGFFTRDILLVEGTTDKGDTVILLVNHFPSKRNQDNDRHRSRIAERLRHTMDTLAANHPTAAIIAMGDFNASPEEPEIRQILMRNGDGRFINLMDGNSGLGSYKYQGKWSFLDQIIVSCNLTGGTGRCPLQLQPAEGKVFDKSFLLLPDERNLGHKVNRTYLGIRYLGGYSDHLPVYIDLERKKALSEGESLYTE